MTDEELANAIVAVGVGRKDAFRADMYDLGVFTGVRYEAKDFVRDWRVAGAMMKKCQEDEDNWYCFSQIMLRWTHYEEAELQKDMADPRAINEACVKAAEDRE